MIDEVLEAGKQGKSWYFGPFKVKGLGEKWNDNRKRAMEQGMKSLDVSFHAEAMQIGFMCSVFRISMIFLF